MRARSVLFLPASNPRAIEKARTLPADMIILDLEDAVKDADKEAARAAAEEAKNAPAAANCAARARCVMSPDSTTSRGRCWRCCSRGPAWR